MQRTRALLGHLQTAIAAVEGTVRTAVQRHAAWRARTRLLTQVPGVGPVLAAALLTRLPELGTLSAKPIAALAGVAPYDRQSGKRRKPSHIQGGRADLRAILYMATLSAVRANPRLALIHARLIQRGKPPKVALVACMRKLLTWLHAMVRDNQPWQPA